jgi:hypothetical protein
MDHSMTVFFVTAFCLLAIVGVLNHARREFSKRQREARMGRALRRSLMESGEIRACHGPEVLPWPPCETNSAGCS